MVKIDDLVSEMAHDMGARPLKTKSDDVNYAETDGDTLFYNAGFMSDIESATGEDGLRFIVAHEMGHQVGGMSQDGHAGEFMADEFAARSLARVGGDFESVAGVFDFLHSPGSDTHPATSARHAKAFEHFRNEVDLNDDGAVAQPKAKNPNVRDLAL